MPTTSSRPSIEMVAFIYLFLRVDSPDQTVSDYKVEHSPKVLKFIVDEHLGYAISEEIH